MVVGFGTHLRARHVRVAEFRRRPASTIVIAGCSPASRSPRFWRSCSPRFRSASSRCCRTFDLHPDVLALIRPYMTQLLWSTPPLLVYAVLPPVPAGDARRATGHVRAARREPRQRRRELGADLWPPGDFRHWASSARRMPRCCRGWSSRVFLLGVVISGASAIGRPGLHDVPFAWDPVARVAHHAAGVAGGRTEPARSRHLRGGVGAGRPHHADRGRRASDRAQHRRFHVHGAVWICVGGRGACRPRRWPRRSASVPSGPAGRRWRSRPARC